MNTQVLGKGGSPRRGHIPVGLSWRKKGMISGPELSVHQARAASNLSSRWHPRDGGEKRLPTKFNPMDLSGAGIPGGS